MLLMLVLLATTSCNRKNRDTAQGATYTCSMHPTVVSDKPGKCPICGMDLVRKARPDDMVEITEDLAKLTKSPSESIVTSIRTVKGEFRKMPVSIHAQGVVTYDPRNVYTISSRIGGRLEKVYLKYEFQKVTKGQKVAEIYSPELLTAQRDLVFLLENEHGNVALIESAKERLSLLGATSTQIGDLVRKKEVQNPFTVYSPFDGYLIINEPQAPSVSTGASTISGSSDNIDDMSSSKRSSANTNPMVSQISTSLQREGSYVAAGQSLFKIVDNSRLLVELNLRAVQSGAIVKGDSVQVNFGDPEKQNGTVDFIQPFYDEGEEFVKVRVFVENSRHLRVGQLVDAVIKLQSMEGLWLPKDAVLDRGLDKIVFVKDGQVFKPQTIKAGTQVEDWIEIRQGVTSSDEIASNAQYLVDSESFIKTPN